MLDKYRERWADILPWVLMGRRAAFQEDLGCSPFQLTFGSAAVLPGAMVDDPGPPPSTPELTSLLSQLEAAADLPAIPMSRHGPAPKTYTKDIDKAPHVYIKLDNPQGLQPRYHGPFLIKRRLGNSTIKIKTGTYKSGIERLEIHSWNNAKPAYMAEAMVAIDRPRLGRPSSKPDALTANSTDAQPSSSEAEKLLIVKKSKQVKPAAPSTHQMSLRNKVAALSAKIQTPFSTHAEPTAPSPAAWSASKQDLDEINRSIRNLK